MLRALVCKHALIGCVTLIFDLWTPKTYHFSDIRRSFLIPSLNTLGSFVSADKRTNKQTNRQTDGLDRRYPRRATESARVRISVKFRSDGQNASATFLSNTILDEYCSRWGRKSAVTNTSFVSGPSPVVVARHCRMLLAAHARNKAVPAT